MHVHRGALFGLAEIGASTGVVAAFVVASARLDACARLDVPAMLPLLALGALVLGAHARACLSYTRLLRRATTAITTHGILSTHTFCMLEPTLDVRSRVLYLLAAIVYTVLAAALRALPCVGVAASALGLLLVALEVAVFLVDSKRVRRRLGTADSRAEDELLGIAGEDDDDDDDNAELGGGGADVWYSTLFSPARAALEAERAGSPRAPMPSAERVFMNGVPIDESMNIDGASSSSGSSDDDDDDGAWSIISRAPPPRAAAEPPTYASVPALEPPPPKPPRHAKDKDA